MSSEIRSQGQEGSAEASAEKHSFGTESPKEGDYKESNGIFESASDDNSDGKDVVAVAGSADDEIPSFIGLRGTKLSATIAFVCGVGFLLFGYDQGVMGSLLLLDKFEKQFPEIDAEHHPNKSTLQGAVIAIYEIGCMCSALSTLYLGDKLGRRKITFIGAFIMIIGGVLQSCAYTTAHLAVARVVSGFGNGYITSTVPVWQAEVSKPHLRGKIICLQGSQIALGICISYWIDFAFYFLDNSKHGAVSFRFPIAFQCIFPIIMMPLIFRLPESPRWLMKKGRNDEALLIFAALNDKPRSSDIVQYEYHEVEKSLLLERSRGGDELDFSVLFKQGKTRNFHRLCLAGWLQLMQQISGINLITYYAGTIFQQYIGMGERNSKILAAANGTEYFLASLLAIPTIERFGRRPLLLWGTAGQCLSMVVLTITAYYADDETYDNKACAVVSAVFLFVFNTFFAIGMLSITWLYSPEISPLEIRAPTSAISTACNWISNFIIVMITPISFNHIKNYTYTIFAAINFLMVPVIYIFYPETAGRSLEEMDVIFSETPIWEPWKVVKIAREFPKSDLRAEEFYKLRPEAEHHENIIDPDQKE